MLHVVVGLEELEKAVMKSQISKWFSCLVSYTMINIEIDGTAET